MCLYPNFPPLVIIKAESIAEKNFMQGFVDQKEIQLALYVLNISFREVADWSGRSSHEQWIDWVTIKKLF